VKDAYFNDGKAEGKIERTLEVAKNMLAENMPLELIAKLTGLSLPQIGALANPLLHDDEEK
jgi:hypothetical protein